MLSLIGWVLAGLVIGAVARLIYPGRQPMGMLATIALGIVGALLGGFVSWMIWGIPGEPFAAHAWPGYLLSILGAVLAMWLYLGMLARKERV
jgi:uncharacterized membrane protein YeaQ/YmgE (transglycosylase-associated protein family)